MKLPFFKILFLTPLILFFSKILFSQSYNFSNYSVPDGLAQSKVYCMIQDRKGYIWIGTEDGVSRFDGKEFKNFSTGDGLVEGAITAILEDQSGTIWFGHSTGLISFYDGKKIGTLNFLSLKLNKRIFSIYQEKSGSIWIGTENFGAIKISDPQKNWTDTSNYHQFNYKEKLSNIVYQIIEDKNGILWFVTDVGIKQFLPAENKFQFFNAKGLPAEPFTSILEDKNGDLWLGMFNHGVTKYKRDNKEFEFYTTENGLPHDWVSQIIEDKNGNIWLGTYGGGAAMINYQNKKIEPLNTNHGLSDNKIRCLMEDREGNICFGTNEGGISFYLGKKFITYSKKDGLLSEQVSSVYADKRGNIWLGTLEGLTVFSQEKNDFKSISLKDKMGYGQVMSITEDKSGNIWIGTLDGGIAQVNPNNLQLKIIPDLIRNSHINSLTTDKDGNIWVGTINGFSIINLSDYSLIRLEKNPLADKYINTIFKDSKGNIWIGTRGEGLFFYDNKSFIKYSSDEGLTHNTPSSITEDKNGNIWIGTEGGGIFKFNPQKNNFISYQMKDGLQSDFISLITADDKNNIWIGTNKGLNKLNLENNNWKFYDKDDGFTGIETKHNSVTKDKMGNLWFGTINGVTKYNSNFDQPNAIEPLTYITNFKIGLNDVEMIPGMKLSYDQRDLNFEFIGLCFSGPRKVKYLYKLEGYDKEFKSTEQNFISYTNLSPSQYAFQIKASNNEEIWNKEPITFSFTIKPPFYQTPWFYILIFIITISGFYGYVKWRTNNLERAKEKLEKQVQERTAEIVKQKEIIEQKNKDITDSINYAKRIQEAILPAKEELKKYFSETFILYTPKDIVSGDFYWYAEKNEMVYFAMADCTGHGVPGALMSMIGNTLLNNIVNSYDGILPASILQHLDERVMIALRQRGLNLETRDGMDVALCSLNRKTNELYFAGANRPMYFFHDKELQQIKYTKFSIGGHVEMMEFFLNEKLNTEKGDTIYLFSDGYPDQFGGEKGKKFTTKKLRELLISIQDKDLNSQQEFIHQTIENWKGNLEQVDDILIMGVKI